MQVSSTPLSLLIRQIETVSRMDEDDRRALQALPVRLRDLDDNRDILRQGQTSTECCLVLSGVVCRYKIIGGGRRQILSLHFAGDIPDLQSLYLERMDHSLGTLTAATVALIPHAAIRVVLANRPTIAAALHRQALIDASIFREWIANVGRRLALERVAHLICECFTRMRVMGLTDSNSFELPVTQIELGDATGLSSVHINRTMQALRRAGLVKSEGKVHTISNWDRMREAGDFDPAYLHLLRPVEAR
jgi:CRP-like cAMP-binding protein